MPITAYLGTTPIVSTALSDDEFDRLRTGPHLQFRCGVRAIPRRSRAHFPHFYHASLADCQFPHTAPETDEHRAIKSAIIRGAEAVKWTAEEEFPNDDRTWIADVRVTNGTRSIAFEAQWSRQDEEGFRYRTERYKEAGLETVWFYRHADPDDVARHGVIPIRKREDGTIVTQGHGGREGQAIEEAVIAILTRSARWKFERSTPELTTDRWSAVPCIGCGAVNLRALESERTLRCTRCAYTETHTSMIQAPQLVGLAEAAGIDATTNLWGAFCGACSHKIGFWALRVCANVATFAQVQRNDRPLKAHWCVPGHSVNTYADMTEALSSSAPPPGPVPIVSSTPPMVVRKKIAEAKRRLEKGAQNYQAKQAKAQHPGAALGATEGPKGVAGTTSPQILDAQKLLNPETEIRRRSLELVKRKEEEDARLLLEFEKSEEARKGAGKRTIQEIHDVTTLFRNELRKDGFAAHRLVAEHGRLSERCPCPECRDLESRLSAHTIKVLFGT